MQLPSPTRATQIEDLATRLVSRSTLLVRALTRQVRGTPVSRTEAEVLKLLSEQPRRVTELAEIEGVAQPTMTALVNRLEASGNVRRERLAHDGRAVLVTITDVGTETLSVVRRQFVAALRDDLEAELSALSAGIDAIAAFADDLLRGDTNQVSSSQGPATLTTDTGTRP
jgi:DNA-binding MarR family transcriptional regulator